MPEYFHQLPVAKKIIESISEETEIEASMVEKDYWIMHCLFGLQQNGLFFEMKGGTSLSKGWKCIDRFSEDIDIRFDAPEALNTRGEGKQSIQSRLAYFDFLAKKIRIPDIRVRRDSTHDDDKARNGGIVLEFEPLFENPATKGRGILLEVGFSFTAPNQGMDFSSWAFDRAENIGMEIRDNRARGIPCFNPEYNFVEKMSAVSRRYRQYIGEAGKSDVLPRQFIRHYYDLYRLLELERVNRFMSTDEYRSFKDLRIQANDQAIFRSKNPFTLPDEKIFKHFEAEYRGILGSLYESKPTFSQIIDRLRSFSHAL